MQKIALNDELFSEKLFIETFSLQNETNENNLFVKALKNQLRSEDVLENLS